ncbi:GH1 family beta-glucosidase [Dictyobacter arantiisoli]|uniref:Beta-glucosidase n=1 Tax=Dictyobacter arantiisoli TaxID=2014874 RepID=A0A5A5TBI7_9CHLR|nr:GH1 family beta-glucosidase [Dictyobacter arantiisoli]GCF08792.1 beta-glucosidase [Dictyobacter arantiisoli]
MSLINGEHPQTSVNPNISMAFPKDFVWGAATAAYQIEGATNEDGRGLTIWDQFAATPGKTFLGQTGEVATDHYHRVAEDVTLMKQLGLGAYRFSVAWSRILPQGTGTINQAGLDFYDHLVDELLAKNIMPMLTLYHWDLPLALHERGGWLNRDTALAFADYAEIVARRLGDRVNYWQTHNEPWCIAYLGYGIGIHAPGEKNVAHLGSVGHHLLVAHGLAVPRLRAFSQPGTQVGITLNFTPAYGADQHPETLKQVEKAQRSNRWFSDPIFRGAYPEGLFADLDCDEPAIAAEDFALINAPLDFLGVNYYTRTLFQWQPEGSTPVETAGQSNVIRSVPGSQYTAMGWEICPLVLTDLLLWLQQEYSVPALYITENGAAFDDKWDGESEYVVDSERLLYLREHIRAAGEAIKQGVPLRGYFAWSLLDNYEWMDGYSKRFGLIYVDYASQRRIIKNSGRWYASLIKAQR